MCSVCTYLAAHGLSFRVLRMSVVKWLVGLRLWLALRNDNDNIYGVSPDP